MKIGRTIRHRHIWGGGNRSMDSPGLEEQVKGGGWSEPERKGGPAPHQWPSHHQLGLLMARADHKVAAPTLQHPCHFTQLGFTYPMAFIQISFSPPNERKLYFALELKPSLGPQSIVPPPADDFSFAT